MKEYNFEKYLEKVKVIEPIDYLNLTELIKKSWKILTDSGGLQKKKAYFAKKRTIAVMPDTGWRKLIEVGWNQLANENNLYEKVFEDNNNKYPENICGNGKSGKKIVEILLNLEDDK